MIGTLQRLVGLDRAILFTLMARGWSMMAGVANILLIARFLTPSEQGYYYTFSGLVSIQVVFELGFSFVILQMAAHERTRLSILDNSCVKGDIRAHARLASIFQKAFRWYTRAAIVMGGVLLMAGIYFFSTHSRGTTRVRWLLPWCFEACAAAILFQIDPIISFLEGCGWVKDVARMRFVQTMTGSVLAWSALGLRHGLFAPALMIGGQATVGFYFVARVHGKMLLGLLRHSPGQNAVSWRREIWPFQWRIAISWASSYLIFQLFTPVLFAYQGPRQAGKMGMSLSIASSLTAVGLAWIATKAAPFGSLVATRQYATLDALFRRTLIQSTVVLLVCELMVIGGLMWVVRHVPKLGERLLPTPTLSLLFLTVLLSHVVICEAYYLRAHKQEPFLWYWIWIAVLSTTGVIWAAREWGAVGVTVVYFLCAGVCRLAAGTFVLFRKRREWHGEMPSGTGVMSEMLSQPLE